MFTGIVEETGIVDGLELNSNSALIKIRAEKVLEGTKTGDSIAVNGVCLTVTDIKGSTFTADIMAETMRRTNLGSLKKGQKVNLERAMAADGRFGGHIVSGHIDGTGVISKIRDEQNARWIYIKAPAGILHLIVQKGSIAIDGISLTVAYLDDESFAVSLIPHTQKETTLAGKKTGDTVNLENDIIAKYTERLLGVTGATQSARDDKFLNWLSGE
ncbi:MAG: riboflavin synthase [Treponema sp.]|nr:riboflavin synthase [Treponema sp.]MBR0487614.1 riboflavin synthase [Treponema sp.]